MPVHPADFPQRQVSVSHIQPDDLQNPGKAYRLFSYDNFSGYPQNLCEAPPDIHRQSHGYPQFQPGVPEFLLTVAHSLLLFSETLHWKHVPYLNRYLLLPCFFSSHTLIICCFLFLSAPCYRAFVSFCFLS